MAPRGLERGRRSVGKRLPACPSFPARSCGPGEEDSRRAPHKEGSGRHGCWRRLPRKSAGCCSSCDSRRARPCRSCRWSSSQTAPARPCPHAGSTQEILVVVPDLFQILVVKLHRGSRPKFFQAVSFSCSRCSGGICARRGDFLLREGDVVRAVARGEEREVQPQRLLIFGCGGTRSKVRAFRRPPCCPVSVSSAVPGFRPGHRLPTRPRRGRTVRNCDLYPCAQDADCLPSARWQESVGSRRFRELLPSLPSSSGGGSWACTSTLGE